MKKILGLGFGILLLLSFNAFGTEFNHSETSRNNSEFDDNELNGSDPSTWAQEEFLIETLHPYQSNSDLIWIVQVRDARVLAIHFEKLETEKNWDFLDITDDQNNVVEILNGSQENFYTRASRTSYLKIKFISNLRNNFYGFKIDRVAWQ